MTASRNRAKSATKRLSPAEAAAEAVERIAPRRLTLENGDIVIRRDRIPRVNPRPASPEPQWRYLVGTYPDRQGNVAFFTSFSHAAAHAEQLASDTHARVMFIEDDMPTLIANYRRRD
jgi:hypothetical protein